MDRWLQIPTLYEGQRIETLLGVADYRNRMACRGHKQYLPYSFRHKPPEISFLALALPHKPRPQSAPAATFLNISKPVPKRKRRRSPKPKKKEKKTEPKEEKAVKKPQKRKPRVRVKKNVVEPQPESSESDTDSDIWPNVQKGPEIRAGQASQVWSQYLEHIRGISDAPETFKSLSLSNKISSEFQEAKHITLAPQRRVRVQSIFSKAASTAKRIQAEEKAEEERKMTENQVQREPQTPQEREHRDLVISSAKRGWFILRTRTRQMVEEKRALNARRNASTIKKWSMLRKGLQMLANLKQSRADLYKRYGYSGIQHGLQPKSNPMFLSPESAGLTDRDFRRRMSQIKMKNKEADEGLEPTMSRRTSFFRKQKNRPKTALI